MKLFVTELRRFWGRRITWGITIVAGLLLVLAAVITFTQTDPPNTDNRERAVAEAERNTQQCTESVLNDVEDGRIQDDFLGDAQDEMSAEEFEDFIANEYCYQDPSWYEQNNTFYASFLLGSNQTTDWSETRPNNSEPSTFMIGGEEFRNAEGGLEGIIPSISVFFLVLSVVIGASFVGAEYKFGTVENLLLWEPRRTRVLLSKFAAGFLSSAVLTALVLAFASGLFYLVASAKGSTAGIDGRFWLDLASTIGRAGLTGGLFFILAMSVAVIARNTTASVGVILGWFVISNIVVEVAAKWFRQWELFMNATSFISESDAVRYTKVAGNNEIVYGHSYLAAGVLVAVWAGIFAVAAMVAFNKRDVD